jgi:hypothetical protein
VIESIMFWNELNNPAHWHGGRPGKDPWRIEDPDWILGIEMVRQASASVRERHPGIECVFSGLSPMDAWFLELAAVRGALPLFDAVAGHNFWFDFGPASTHGEDGLEALPSLVDSFRRVTEQELGRPLPVILSEIGVSSFSGDELQGWATEKTLRVIDEIMDRYPDTRATWYSLFDLPEEYVVTSLYEPDSHGEVRHRKFGLFRYREGRMVPKGAVRPFLRRRHPEKIGITQWFRLPWPDTTIGLTSEAAQELSYRVLDTAPPLLKSLEVEWLRINVTWCDWYCASLGEVEDGLRWFDDLISALSGFRLLVTIFQAPPQLVLNPGRYAAGSVPKPEHIGKFTRMVVDFLSRYAGAVRSRDAA